MLASLFPKGLRRRVVPNAQTLDHEGLRGRLMSASYAPASDDPACEAMLADLHEIFERHQQRGTVRMAYRTEVFTGVL